MDYGRNAKWKNNSPKYTKKQVEAVLKNIGLIINSETHTNLLMYCPFHGNRDTPSFAVSKETGLFLCFNPACDRGGTLVELVKALTKRNEFEAVRFISKKGGETSGYEDTHELLTIPAEDEFMVWPQETIDRLRATMWTETAGRAYMHGRGFSDDTLAHFDVGYSAKQNMITVPVHSPTGIPVGHVGRSIEGKAFKNSTGLPRNKTLFNIHRAKKTGDTIVVTESSFDAMRVHQSGYPNVVAILGGHMSPHNYALLDRYFSTIVLMTDFDDKSKHRLTRCAKCGPVCQGHNPGRDIGYSIAAALRNKDILWASYDYRVVYPHGAKDAGDMTDEEIKRCIENAVSHLEYSQWNIY